MKRLWVRLSIAFGIVIFIGILMVTVPALAISQDGVFRSFIIRRYTQSNGLLERLTTYYAENGSWAGVDGLLNAEDTLLPRGPNGNTFGLVFADEGGRVLYDPHTQTVGEQMGVIARAEALPVTLEGRTLGYLLLVLLQRGDVPENVPEDVQSVIVVEVIRTIVVISSVGGFISIFVAVIVSRWLTLPLAELAKTTRSFGPNNLSVRAQVRGSTEIAAVAMAFNETADALERAERLRRKLVADIAHEFRTPLTVLEANLQAILDGVYPLDISEIERLQDQTALLHRLIDDLRELALAESGQLRLTLDAVDIDALVRSEVDHFSAMAETHGVRLDYGGTATPLIIDADRSRLMQVLNNLLHNALSHTPAGGRITLAVQQEQDYVRIDVRDTGAGIPPQELNYIFERFYRVDSSRSRSTGGAGLGLAIVRALVQMHHGNVSVSSTGVVGEGAVFTVRLPILENHASPLSQSARVVQQS